MSKYPARYSSYDLGGGYDGLSDGSEDQYTRGSAFGRAYMEGKVSSSKPKKDEYSFFPESFRDGTKNFLINNPLCAQLLDEYKVGKEEIKKIKKGLDSIVPALADLNDIDEEMYEILVKIVTKSKDSSNYLISRGINSKLLYEDYLTFKSISIPTKVRLLENPNITPFFYEELTKEQEVVRVYLSLNPILLKKFPQFWADEDLYKDFLSRNPDVQKIKDILENMEYQDRGKLPKGIQLSLKVGEVTLDTEDLIIMSRNNFKNVFEIPGTKVEIRDLGVCFTFEEEMEISTIQKALDIISIISKEDEISIHPWLDTEDFTPKDWEVFCTSIKKGYPHLKTLGVYENRNDFTDNLLQYDENTQRAIRLGKMNSILKDDQWFINPLQHLETKNIPFRYRIALNKATNATLISELCKFSKALIDQREHMLGLSLILTSYLEKLGLGLDTQRTMRGYKYFLKEHKAPSISRNGRDYSMVDFGMAVNPGYSGASSYLTLGPAGATGYSTPKEDSSYSFVYKGKTIVASPSFDPKHQKNNVIYVCPDTGNHISLEAERARQTPYDVIGEWLI